MEVVRNYPNMARTPVEAGGFRPPAAGPFGLTYALVTCRPGAAAQPSDGLGIEADELFERIPLDGLQQGNVGPDEWHTPSLASVSRLT
jgi:hypothetical protein